MTNEFRRVVAGSLAAAVVIGASAGAASAYMAETAPGWTGPEDFWAGRLGDNWAPHDPNSGFGTGITDNSTWESHGNGFAGTGGLQFSPAQWEAYGGLEFAPTADLATQEQQQLIWDRIQALQGQLQSPPERLEQEAQLGQVAEVAREAARAEVREQAAEPAPAAEAEARAEVAVPELAPAAEVAEPTNLGAAGAGIQTIAGPVVDASLLEITWEELIGPFPEGEQNTAALAAWDWFRLHGYRGIPGDGAEKLYAPSHPRYAETVLVGELPESVWCFPILPGSDVTDHAAEVLKAAGWFEADLWEPGGAPWLLPPEAAN